jgi:hypothetical protein
MYSSTRQNLLVKRVLTVILLMLLQSCNPSQEVGDDQEPVNLTSQEQALESESNDIGPARVKCPDTPLAYKLQLNHTFDFSPNRQTEMMQVTGRTSSDAWCLVIVDGTKVEADDCIVDYNYSGFIQGSDGKCDVSGSSTALISIEGECMPGVKGSEFAEIYLEITESENPDGDISGALNCPGHSSTYIGFFPPSYFIATFPVTDTTSYDTDNGPDLTGQFEFNKHYEFTPSGEPED